MDVQLFLTLDPRILGGFEQVITLKVSDEMCSSLNGLYCIALIQICVLTICKRRADLKILCVVDLFVTDIVKKHTGLKCVLLSIALHIIWIRDSVFQHMHLPVVLVVLFLGQD